MNKDKYYSIGKMKGGIKGQMKKKVFVTAIFLVLTFLMMRGSLDVLKKSENTNEYTRYNEYSRYKEINGTIEKGETLFDIFKRYNLNITELFRIKEASAHIHKLREVYPGQLYKIIIDSDNQVNAFGYWINDDSILSITRTESGFLAEKKAVEYEKKIQHVGGPIKDNLISSVGEGRENLMLALQLSDIFAWDIDFTTDIRNGDSFKVIAEGFNLNGEFKKYGDILSAEFTNNGETYRAYRFELNGKTDYYDAEGKSLRRAFLKAPLSYRRISSGFSRSRFHPILRIYRPSHGVDFAAPAGTPVSAVGDGTVNFAGYKGGYGNIAIIRHPNGWKTYYAHLSRFGKGVRKAVKVKQGQIIGYVGSTGLSTGPHLHYEVRINNKPVNPLTVKLPRGDSIPKKFMAEFKKTRNRMDAGLASISMPVFAFDGKHTDSASN